MDGIKGSARKGTKALDRLAVVWRAVDDGKGFVLAEPREGQHVPETAAANWKGANEERVGNGKNLGLRTESPVSANLSRASSIQSEKTDPLKESEDGARGLKAHGPSGEEHVSHLQPEQLRDEQQNSKDVEVGKVVGEVAASAEQGEIIKEDPAASGH